MYKRKLFIFFALLFLSTHTAFALARAPFPDGAKLQPIPTYVAANVSGNVDSTTTSFSSGDSVAPDQGDSANNSAATITTPAPDQSQPASPQPSTSGSYIVWIIAVVLILVIAAFGFLFWKV